MPRTYVSAQDTGSTVSTVAFTKVSASIALLNGRQYAFFWKVASGPANANNTALQASLYRSGSPNETIQTITFGSRNQTDIVVLGSSDVWTSNTSSVQTFGIQCSENGAATSFTVSDAYLTILQLETSETASHTGSLTSTTSATPQVLQEITVPSGSWYVIGGFQGTVALASQSLNSVLSHIYDSSSNITYMQRDQFAATVQNDSNSSFWHTTAQVNPTASTVYQLRYAKVDPTMTQAFQARYRSLFVLDKSTFLDSTSSVSISASSTTQITPQTKVTLFHTPTASANYLVLGGWTGITTGGTNGQGRVSSSFSRGGTAQFSRQLAVQQWDPENEFQNQWAATTNLTTAATSWSITYNMHSASLDSVVQLKNAAIMVFNLDSSFIKPRSFGYILL